MLCGTVCENYFKCPLSCPMCSGAETRESPERFKERGSVRGRMDRHNWKIEAGCFGLHAIVLSAVMIQPCREKKICLQKGLNCHYLWQLFQYISPEHWCGGGGDSGDNQWAVCVQNHTAPNKGGAKRPCPYKCFLFTVPRKIKRLSVENETGENISNKVK